MHIALQHGLCSGRCNDRSYREQHGLHQREEQLIDGHERVKYIDICKHFTHEAMIAIKNGHMILRKTVTTSQLADIMCTNGLLGQPLKPSSKSVVVQEKEY